MSPAVQRARPIPAPAADPAAALRQAVVALAQARQHRPSHFDGVDHWPRDAHPSGTAESRERLARSGERQIWMAQNAAQDAAQTTFAREVAAYTRALRRGGFGLKQVLLLVTPVVGPAAAPLPATGPCDAIVHGAGRYCVTAYFGETSPGETPPPSGA